MATDKSDLSNLFNYAFCGTPADFGNILTNLASLADDEIWSFDNTPNSVLKNYLLNTFRRCYKQTKVIVNEDGTASCFNTGLLTPNGHDIVALFEKNRRQDAQPWVLKGFKDNSSREFMEVFRQTPSLATYTDDFEEYYYNPDLEIVINTDHILDDNWDRINSKVHLDKTIVKALLTGALEEAKQRIKRNIRLVVPQFYKDKIMYLVPIKIPIAEGAYETMALAVEKINECQYRANTIFTKEMAYEKARLLMRPESNWLI